MSIPVNINGVIIPYPQTGDTGWGNNATKFAEEVASVLGKIGQSQAPVNDDIIVSPGNLSVTSGNLSVGGNASVTGNTTLTGNITVNGNSNLGNGTSDTTAITGILNVDSGVLYVDPTNNRVGINDVTPSEALDVTGNALISGTLAVTGNSTLTGNLSVNGNTTLGDASGDSLTINSNGVSIPNGLNFDSNTLVINAANNRVGIGVASPGVPLDIQADSSAFGMDIRGRSADNIGLIRFLNNAGSPRHRIGIYPSDALSISNAAGTETLTIAQNGQLNAVVPGGSTLYPGYLCRAWVNFNGTGTVAIRASGNVSSITDNGTGDYTVNFINSMPDANYSCIMSCGDITYPTLSIRSIVTQSTSISSVRVNIGFPTNASPSGASTSNSDQDKIFIAVFR